MNLYIKQKVFSIGDKYTIFDVNENPIYFVEGEIFTIGAKLRITNTQGNELYFIKQKIKFFLAEYEIYKDKEIFAVINQKFSFLKPNLTIESKLGNFEIVGDFLGLDYEILLDGQVCGYLHRKFLSWGDTYELSIPDGMDDAFFVALVVTIDNCLHNQNSSGSSSSGN